MNRVIFLVLGLGGGLWALHDVAKVPDPASMSHRVAIASIAPVSPIAEQSSDETSRGCQSPDEPADDVAAVDQSPNPGANTPGSTPATTVAAGQPAPQLEFPSPRVESNGDTTDTGTYSEDETCGTAHPVVKSRPDVPAVDAAASEPAKPQIGSPEIGAPADIVPDNAAVALWLEANIAALRSQIVTQVDSFVAATGDETEQLPMLGQRAEKQCVGYVADQARAMEAAQHIPPPGYREIQVFWSRARVISGHVYTGPVWPYKFVKIAAPTQPAAQSQPPAAKPASEVSFLPDPKTTSKPTTDTAAAEQTTDPTSHRKQSPPPPVYKPSLSPELEALAERVHRALNLYRHDRLLNTGVSSTWDVMHRIVAFGIPTEVHRDSPDGEPVNAIGWLLWGGRCTGQPLVVLQNGRPLANVGVGVQGHPAQFLGMLAQSRVSPDSPFQLQGKHFTVRDLIEEEKLNCDTQMELTFKLISLSYYLKSDEQWTASDGGRWSVARLVHEELRQPIQGAACGGTHRLFGLSSSYKMRIARGEPVDGEFLRAQKYVRDYQRYTLYRLRNPDGSFSTDWFKRPADSGDPARKLQTTGHMLEWLVFSLEDDQLRDPRVEQTVDFIATLLIRNPDKQWSVGPLGHALHALAIYDNRVFGAADPVDVQQQDVARRPEDSAATAPASASPTGARPNSRPAAEQPLLPRVHPPARRPYDAPVAESAMASASR